MLELRSMIEGPLWRDEEYCLVKDMRNEGNWDFSRCSFDFPNKLTLLLKDVPFPTNHWGEDKIVWASSPSGDFEQKSAYAIARGDYDSSNSFDGKWIWNIDSMPKIKSFIWKCFLHSIPMGEVFQERGIIQDAQCQICNNGRESILHVLRDCRFAKSIWEKLHIHCHVQDFYSRGLCDWLAKNAKLTSYKVELVLWTILFPFAV